jgi:Protein of unknown function (DUF2281).
MTKLKELKSKIEKLSPGAINDLDLFVEALMNKSKSKSGQLKQNWAGGLKAVKKQFSSLELQKKALEWRKG